MAERAVSTPPEHTVNPDDVDEDQHPTGAWLTVGDAIDADTAGRLWAMAGASGGIRRSFGEGRADETVYPSRG